MGMTPREIVAELDRFIIGQQGAKRAIAIAIRNRERRRLLPPGIREEVMPKNILMIGPTGVGKTEIARRLAKLVAAPFVKVEATKFTEVGYVGRDVDSMVRDLVEAGIRMVKARRFQEVTEKASRLAEERLIDLLLGIQPSRQVKNPFTFLMGIGEREAGDGPPEERARKEEMREAIRARLSRGELEDESVEVEVEEEQRFGDVWAQVGLEEMGLNLQDMLGNLFPKRRRRRRLRVAEARKILQQQEADRLIDPDEVHQEAITRVEEEGIIFLDEIDKIAGREGGAGPDVSREGVQRDILPIVEGSTVMTKYGPVRTDHILFIAAGAFHVTKPSDLIPELQGRFPIRVELSSLTKEEFERILVEPENALTKQYTALLETDGVELVFTRDGIAAIAEVACKINEEHENIGARRLHTILEQVLEEISFSAPELSGRRFEITGEYVERRLAGLLRNADLSRYIL
ncbi:MAG: ATP-dependent protease ATPase subunit HslU [Firmicutes bacterium]|nr:ATP-dependent protease ATPase subunit HslU [Bacillota bacterium]